jgi:endonuclease/exonuclease/phosphatase family metal-dependent hydrolase
LIRRLALAAAWLLLGAPAQAADAPAAVTLRVMTFNVWYGGEQVSLEKIGEAIRAADPDIVGLQEADRNLERIAELAGLPFVDPRRRLLSRWPIFDSGSGVRTDSGASPYSTTSLDLNALHAWVMVRPGRVVAVSNVHLSNGAALDGRRRAETEPLTALGRLAGDGTPVFLTGDFNTSSHLDETGVAQAPDHAVTRMLADAGLRDSYREAHPDPDAQPGLTWTPGAPHPLADHERSHHRIDYVFTAGRSRTVASQVVGEAGGPYTDIAIFPWPSDHRAVVSTFEVVPTEAPALVVATPRLVEQGGVVLVRTWDPRGPAWTALVARRGGGPAQALTGVRNMPHDYQRTIPLSTVGLAPGEYDVLLVDEEGSVLRRCAFTIAAPGAKPAIEALDARVKLGSPIRVRWQNAPGALRDWIGLYRAGETDVSQYLAFTYTEAAFAGEASVVPDPGSGPLAPGSYELRLLHDESYVVLATAPVELVP